LIIAQSEAAQDISFAAMKERQQAVLDIIVKDPAVESLVQRLARAAASTRSMMVASIFSSSPMAN